MRHAPQRQHSTRGSHTHAPQTRHITSLSAAPGSPASGTAERPRAPGPRRQGGRRCPSQAPVARSAPAQNSCVRPSRCTIRPRMSVAAEVMARTRAHTTCQSAAAHRCGGGVVVPQRVVLERDHAVLLLHKHVPRQPHWTTHTPARPRAWSILPCSSPRSIIERTCQPRHPVSDSRATASHHEPQCAREP